MEIWKDVKDYEGSYQVSNLGRVKSLSNNKTRKERILKSNPNSRGYLNLSLYKFGKYKVFRVHQLVAIVFLHHIPNKQELVVNHKDFNKLNNHVDNLEIVTQRENANQLHLKSSSEYIGVCWDKACRKWRARITINREQINLGVHINELDAANAYKSALRKLNN